MLSASVSGSVSVSASEIASSLSANSASKKGCLEEQPQEHLEDNAIDLEQYQVKQQDCLLPVPPLLPPHQSRHQLDMLQELIDQYWCGQSMCDSSRWHGLWDQMLEHGEWPDEARCGVLGPCR